VRQEIIRKFLETEGVLPKDGEPLPVPATVEEIATFEGGGGGGPVYPRTQLDWSRTLAQGRWNKEATTLLAKAVQDKLKAHSANFDTSRLQLKSLRSEIIKKLRKTRQDVNNAELINQMNDSSSVITKRSLKAQVALKQKMARENSRKFSVCFPLFSHNSIRSLTC